ncbi:MULTISPECIES: DUF4127 family protein [unclassified Actinomyces]|uniref:DUF4127 family protein n=1 Tax=unclassified Actinomyces TaxID=2609248 RepID=UPI002017E37D|nr:MULTISPECIES: DUF4127 family protein [unclassified Actinomyces]MCL3776613.1 DUF4127 family protein [Actinomyces sp. AC-20-1]MCL3790104.1 DUF4127 family protein [Actinomyces sp. 187325]MCL3792406.1 DUF4127 family protein [Actinomyces sp. 186855]MCL3793479.1 DUF4127 family protein [Actinomyces sp. 217892]
MHIVVIPLDERPVNTQIPALVAAIGGAGASLPAGSLLPSFRRGADLDALAAWLQDIVAQHSGATVVVCADTLVFGGIIPARLTHDSVLRAANHLEVLRHVKSVAPQTRIIASSLVMRASDSYSNQEEPRYWSSYGHELHVLGADLHRSLELDITGELIHHRGAPDVPVPVLEDYTGRRLRNHIINLLCLDLLRDGVLDGLVVTADDTAYYSAGSAEQYWINHWRRAVPSLSGVLMYPGADEVGATMTARALVGERAAPRVTMLCADDEGLLRIPSYENVPLVESASAQIRACGSVRVTDLDDADICLVVHAPGPVNDDWWGSTPHPSPTAAAATAALVRRLLADGRRVALADVRYTNGADPLLVEDLLSDGSFWSLVSFGGWNTAGNTIGAALATAVAEVVGRRDGALDEAARDRALWLRLLDDYLYQTRIRPRYYDDHDGDSSIITDDTGRTAYEAQIAGVMRGFIAEQSSAAPAISLAGASLPWHRPFEVAIELI